MSLNRLDEDMIGDGLGLATQAELNAVDEKVEVLKKDRINVLDHGAKGDGINDDTAAIQNAINYAVANTSPLYFPHGKYKITSGLTVQHSDNTKWQPGIHIYGAAPGMSQDGTLYGSVICPTNAVTGAAFSVVGTANTDNSYKGMVNGMLIENIGILGVNGGSNGDGFRFKYFVNLTLRNVWSMYNKNGFTFERQANASTYGYGFGVTLDRIFAVSNRGWGISALDAGSINLTLLDPTVQGNILGGMTCAGGPVIMFAGGFYGNGGPALVADDPSGASAIMGPFCYGTRFETNNTATLGPQVDLISANMPLFDACWFLTSTDGEHGIRMGEDATKIVYRPALRNCYFNGKLSNTNQRAYIIGNNCQNAVIENCRELNYTTKFGGTAGLKSDLLYMEKGNQFGNPINVMLNGAVRALATFQNGDTNPRFSINGNGDFNWGPGGTSASDVRLYRLAADKLKSDDKIIATMGIGVGNSTTASAVGTLTKKMEVFDDSGNSLGFVPIYSSIT